MKEEKVEKATVKSNVTNLIYSFPGFEGDEETNTRIQLAIYQLPEPLRKILTTEVQVLNGCHPMERLYLIDVCMVFLIRLGMVLMENMVTNGI